MSEVEIRDAIVKFCVWKYDPHEQEVVFVDGGDIVGIPWPSLDAMHAVEDKLTQDEQFEYHNNIFDLVPSDENHGPCGGEGGDIMTPSGFSMLHAKFDYRAKAFLKTIGAWRD